jgi:hypothetical protein
MVSSRANTFTSRPVDADQRIVAHARRRLGRSATGVYAMDKLTVRTVYGGARPNWEEA